jgi:hypothetical protein
MRVLHAGMLVALWITLAAKALPAQTVSNTPTPAVITHTPKQPQQPAESIRSRILAAAWFGNFAC